MTLIKKKFKSNHVNPKVVLLALLLVLCGVIKMLTPQRLDERLINGH